MAGTALLSWSPIGLALGLSNVVLYGFVYTPLKQRTTLNTPIGAIVGAIPPAIGYLAGGGGLDFGLAGMQNMFGCFFCFEKNKKRVGWPVVCLADASFSQPFL